MIQKKLKIIQLISNIGQGGAERLVVDLCNQFSKNDNIEIVLCVYNEDVDLPNFKSELNNKVRYVNLDKKNQSNLVFQMKLFRFLTKEKPDIVNSHLSGTVIFLYLPILFKRRIRFFHTIHNIAEEELPNKSLRKIRKLVYLTNRLIPVSISHITQLSHTDLYKINSVTIQNGITRKDKTNEFEDVKKEIISYKKNKETKVFLSVGRISSRGDQKNYKLLIEVFGLLHKNDCNVVLIIIGSDNSKGKTTLINLMKEKTENVFFVGPKKNISDYMLNSDFYCLSSKFEGSPITIIEALSFGLPILSTNVGGISELITNGTNGLLVEKLDAESYYNKMLEIMKWDDNKLKQVKTENISKFDQQYSIEVAAKNYLELYLNNYGARK